MHPLAAGAAFVDRTGSVLAADAGFTACLGLDASDPAAALRARAESSAELRALLAGEGPEVARIAGADGGTVEVERIGGAAGALLVLRENAAHGEEREHALRSRELSRVVAGVAHDIKNPLNAMSLQLALVGEKLAGAGEQSATAANLSALRDQIGRVNEVLRRMVDVLDPSAPFGLTDAGGLLADAAALLAHEARRRRIQPEVHAPRGSVETPCDPARVGRLVLGLYGGALAATPDGGAVSARAEARGREVAIIIEHATGDPDGGVGYETDVAAAGAAALGGRFELGRPAPQRRTITLTLPGNGRE